MQSEQCIEKVDVGYYRVPLAEPLVDARHGTHTYFELIVAKVRVGDNEGVGYTYTGGKGGRAIYEMLVHDLAPALVGRSAENIADLWDFMNWHIHYVGRGGIAGFAISAIDIALWDLHAKQAEKPLWQLLDGDGKSVKTYVGLIDLDYTMDRHQEVITEKLEAGHTGIKIKIGLDDLDADAKRIRAIRAFMGSDVDMMVDANMKWDAQTAIDVGKGLEDLDLLWFEEPVLPDDFEAFEQVGRAIDIPLAQGENLHTVLEFRSALDTGVLAFPQPDASNIGGITGWLQIADMCRERDLPVCSHGMQELHVSLLSAMPNAGYMEMHSFPIDQYTVHPLTVKEGWVSPPSVSGTGVVFDWDLLASYKG